MAVEASWNGHQWVTDHGEVVSSDPNWGAEPSGALSRGAQGFAETTPFNPMNWLEMLKHPIDTAKSMVVDPIMSGASALEDAKNVVTGGDPQGRLAALEKGFTHAVGSVPLIGQPLINNVTSKWADGDYAGGAGSLLGLASGDLLPPAIKGGTRAIKAIEPRAIAGSVGRGVSAAGRGVEAASQVMKKPALYTSPASAMLGHPALAALEVASPYVGEYAGKGMQKLGKSLEGIERKAPNPLEQGADQFNKSHVAQDAKPTPRSDAKTAAHYADAEALKDAMRSPVESEGAQFSGHTAEDAPLTPQHDAATAQYYDEAPGYHDAVRSPVESDGAQYTRSAADSYDAPVPRSEALTSLYDEASDLHRAMESPVASDGAQYSRGTVDSYDAPTPRSKAEFVRDAREVEPPSLAALGPEQYAADVASSYDSPHVPTKADFPRADLRDPEPGSPIATGSSQFDPHAVGSYDAPHTAPRAEFQGVPESLQALDADYGRVNTESLQEAAARAQAEDFSHPEVNVPESLQFGDEPGVPQEQPTMAEVDQLTRGLLDEPQDAPSAAGSPELPPSLAAFEDGHPSAESGPSYTDWAQGMDDIINSATESDMPRQNATGLGNSRPTNAIKAWVAKRAAASKADGTMARELVR